MTSSVVIMIIIGFILIFASFFISEKFAKNENEELELLTIDESYEFSERELRIIKRKIEDVIARQAKDILYETNDSLSNMANEKTLALGDYAVAVCEEIEKNHKEVMFLYSMLDDKQKEIMNTVRAVDAERQTVQKMLEGVRHHERAVEIQESEAVARAAALQRLSEEKNMAEALQRMTEAKAPAAKPKTETKAVAAKPKAEAKAATAKPAAVKQAAEPAAQPANNTEKETVQAPQEYPVEQDSEKTFEAENSEAVSKAAPADADEHIFDEIDKTEINFDEVLEDEFQQNENSNEIILGMYQNGNSILEIAKQLGLGVGEVKLVIDLYQGE